METKICNKCKCEKELKDFNKKSNMCKNCQKEYKRQYYLQNKEKVKLRVKEYREKHKDEIREKRKEYAKEYNKKYKIEHKEQIKEYNLQNKDKWKKYKETYRKNHKEKINAYNRKYKKNRKQNDDLFRFKIQIRGLIGIAFRRNGYTKRSSAEKILGCDYEYLFNYLIKTYENNYNEKWKDEYINEVHIDHIIPLSTAKNEDEIIKLFHYSNLQFLKAKDNLEKSDKLDWSLK